VCRSFCICLPENTISSSKWLLISLAARLVSQATDIDFAGLDPAQASIRWVLEADYPVSPAQVHRRVDLLTATQHHHDNSSHHIWAITFQYVT
jgi:hypothetical protein